MTRALLWTNQHNAGWPQRQSTDLAEGRLPGETCGRSTHHTAAMPRQFSNLARRPIRKENPMKATITLATARATPYAIEHIKPKDLKQIPKEFAAARTMWESGDHAGAKSVLLQLPGGAIGEPLWGGDDLSETDSNDLEPTFDLGEVWWTDNPIPDVAIEMKVTISLKKGVDVKSASKAVLEIATSEYGTPELFGQTVYIEWKYGSKSWTLASAEPWKFSMQ